MKKSCFKNLTKSLSFLFLIGLSFHSLAQEIIEKKQKNEFWEKVQFGGGVGLSVGSGFTDIMVAPSAIYNFNRYVATGFGLQGSIVAQKGVYNSTIYGINWITLLNPIDEIQLSVELEQVRVNNTFRNPTGTLKENFWNTAVFVGTGYTMDNLTIGLRYNLLFNKDKNVYTDAMMPFVRVYF